MKTKPKMVARLSDVIDQTYCSMDPPYPQCAYVATVLCTYGKNRKLLWPFDKLFYNLDEVSDALRAFRKEVSEEKEAMNVPDVCFVFPVTFSRRYPLRPEFWQKPTNELSFEQWGGSFIRVLHNPMLHSLLVSPIKLETSWEFRAALPMLRTASDAGIEQLMLTSDLVISPEAKYAAVYLFSTIMVYNWVERWCGKDLDLKGDDEDAN